MSERGPHYPDAYDSVLQFRRALDAYQYLERKTAEVQAAPDGPEKETLANVVDDNKHGVRRIIFARFADLIDQGEGRVALGLLRETLGPKVQERPSLASRQRREQSIHRL